MAVRVDVELVERDGAIAAVDDALAAAVAGSGRVLVVEGEAGLGKTSVLSALRARARDSPARVLAARGTELEREFPFEVVGSLLRSELRGTARERLLAGTPPPIRALLGVDADASAVPLEPSRSLLDAIFRIVEALCEQQPLVLCVDDVHWADAATLHALAFVANRAEELGLLLALGRRSGEPSAADDALDAISALPHATRVELAPLSPEGTATLVAGRGSHELSGADLAAMHTVTRGNPLLIAHVADGVARDGVGGLASPDALSGAAVSGLMLRRLAQASDAAQAVARAVSVLGDAAPVAHVAALSELAPEATLAAAAELDRLGIFATDEPLTFAHPLLAAAVADDAGANARGLAHLRAARVLRAAGEPATQIAGHLARGPAAGDALAVADLRAAASAARARAAPATAVALLRRAMAEPPPGEDAAAVRLDLGLAEQAAGDAGSAWEHLSGAVEDAGADADVAFAACRAQLSVSGYGAAIDSLLRAAQVRETSAPDDALRLRGAASFFSYYVPLAERREIVLPDVSELPGTTPGQRLALTAILAHSGGPGNRAAPLGRMALRALGDGALVADSPFSVEFAAGPLLGLTEAECLEDASRELTHVQAAGERLGWPGTLISARFPHPHLLLLQGEVAASIAEGNALIAKSDMITGPVESYIRARVLTGVLAHDGAAAADALLRESGLDGELAPEWDYLLPARAHVHLACGRADAALRDALAWRAFAVAGSHSVQPIESETIEALALHAAGRGEEALASAERELDRARTWGAPGRIAGHLRCVARLSPERALALLDEALALAAPTGLRLEHARVLLDLGMAQRRDGRRTDARATLEQAVQATSECQAHALAKAGLEELRIIGARPRRRAFSGVDALTPSERRVAEMAAAGQTNREIAQALFLTIKTIDSHLMRTYRKLGISSRRDLAAALQRS